MNSSHESFFGAPIDLIEGVLEPLIPGALGGELMHCAGASWQNDT